MDINIGKYKSSTTGLFSNLFKYKISEFDSSTFQNKKVSYIHFCSFFSSNNFKVNLEAYSLHHIYCEVVVMVICIYI